MRRKKALASLQLDPSRSTETQAHLSLRFEHVVASDRIEKVCFRKIPAASTPPNYRLIKEEFTVMRQHSVMGFEALRE